MTTTFKTTILALVTAFNLAGCGWTFEPIDDSSTSGMDSAADESTPTGGVDGTPMHFICHNDSNYQVNAAGGSVYFPLMHTCVEIEGADWMSEENMTKILDGCSNSCQTSIGGWKNHCVNEGWKSVELTDVECNPDDYNAEYGGGILWLDGVQSVDRQVKCDLRTTCGEAFGATISEMLRTDALLPDERPPSGAQNGSELELRLGYGQGKPLQLDGTIEYSTVQCGESACPFYLGDATFIQAADDWRMLLDLGDMGGLDKQVANVYMRLARPALGISLRDGQVAFPADTLTFRVEVEVAGRVHPLVENGTHTFWVRNPVPLLGRLHDGSFELATDVPTGFGVARLSTVRGQ